MASVNPIEYMNLYSLWTGLLDFLPKFLGGLMILVLFYAIYKGTVLVLEAALVKQKIHKSLINLTIKSYRFALIVLGFVIALNQVGVQLGAAITGLGIVGVGIGFAARDTLSNYIAGITIFWDKPFLVGDYVEVQKQYGRVTDITLRSTRIRNLQNEYVIVPNQDIINELVVNHSKNGEVRVEIPVSISYQDDINRAREVMLALVNSDEDNRLSKYLRPTIVIKELGNDGVEILLRIWINKAEDEYPVFYDYIEKAKKAIEENGMTIPFPQRVIWQGNQ